MGGEDVQGSEPAERLAVHAQCPLPERMRENGGRLVKGGGEEADTMKTHHHLWEQVVSPENLMGAATDAIRGKRCRSSAARFFSHWETEVWRLHGKLVSGEYQPGAYTHIKIYEPKERVVAAAPFRDRVVHYALVRVLQPIFEPRFLEDSYA